MIVGLFKDCIYCLNEIITFGGASRLEEAEQEYKANYSIYKQSYDEIAALQKSIAMHQDDLGKTLSSAMKTLTQTEKLLKNSCHKLNAHKFSEASSLGAISKFNSSYSIVLSSGFGSVVGGSTAVGAWAIVSFIGSASTGTAIASISGVAATNATLAWFGGGALAAGGAGMSGGLMVLGGIVAAPIIYFAAKGAHKKAKKFETETQNLIEEIASLALIETKTRADLQEVSLYSLTIQKYCNEFVDATEKLLDIVYPYGWLSYLSHRLHKVFGLDPYKPEQSSSITNIDTTAMEFLRLFEKHAHS